MCLRVLSICVSERLKRKQATALRRPPSRPTAVRQFHFGADTRRVSPRSSGLLAHLKRPRRTRHQGVLGMKKLKVLVSLITQDNDYQREQAAVAEDTGRRLGVDVQVMFANSDAIEQTKQILAAIRLTGDDRPDAIVCEPVGTGMPQVAKAAADSGIGWLVLNREADYLVPLRQSSTTPIGSFDCDNVEVGRIQGRQFAALLPKGGKVLYIEGPSTDLTKQRRAGVAETLPANIELKAVRGKWTEESGYQAVFSRLPMQTPEPPNIDVIGCQNDAMAM